MSRMKFQRALLAIVLLVSTSVGAVTPNDLAKGPPALVKDLGGDTFVPVEVERLAQAQVWFVDYEWHRQHGVEIPSQGIQSEEFKKQILDAYAWQSRGADDPSDAFTGEKRLSYADYYGGYGLGVNLGSGRAAANGIVQVKGVRTPLAKDTDPFHSNGAVQSIEAVDEAIWSQILDGEMKFGSNKVIAVILTGTYGKMKSGQVFPRALIVREMAVRPAHYMLNWSRRPDLDRERIAVSTKSLLKNLPYPPHYTPKGNDEDVVVGLKEFVDREALAQAEYYAKRMYFGSVSPSNVELSGRRLDLGDHTAQEGYSRIYRISDLQSSAFGNTDEFLEMIEAIQESYFKTLPRTLLGRNFPSARELKIRFESSFAHYQSLEMVRLTGVPREILDVSSQDPSVVALGKVLLKVAQAGNHEIQQTDPQGWANKGTFKFNQILAKLGAAEATSAETIEHLLNQDMNADQSLKKALAEAYAKFRAEMTKKAATSGLSPKALNVYFKEASAIRNHDRPGLVRGDRRWKEMWATTDLGIQQRDNTVEKYIEEQTSKNIFNFKDAAPFQVVLDQQTNRAEGVSLRRVYDAKKGKYENILRISVSQGNAQIQGQKFSVEELKNLAFEANTKDGKIVAIRPVQNGDKMEYTFPVGTKMHLSELKVASGSRMSVATPAVQNKDKAPVKSCQAFFLTGG